MKFSNAATSKRFEPELLNVTVVLMCAAQNFAEFAQNPEMCTPKLEKVMIFFFNFDIFFDMF